jgi:hypothetical protein
MMLSNNQNILTCPLIIILEKVINLRIEVIQHLQVVVLLKSQNITKQKKTITTLIHSILKIFKKISKITLHLSNNLVPLYKDNQPILTVLEIEQGIKDDYIYKFNYIHINNNLSFKFNFTKGFSIGAGGAFRCHIRCHIRWCHIRCHNRSEFC